MTRGPRTRATFALAFALVLGAGCTAPDVVEESRELGRAGRHIDAVDRLERAAREGTRSELLRAELLRQQEMRAAQLSDRFVVSLRAGQLDEAEQALATLRSEQPSNVRLPVLREQLAAARRHEVAIAQASAAIAAGRNVEARRLVRGVLAENPAHPGARPLNAALLASAGAVPARSDAPELPPAALRKLVTLEFRDATLRNVFETLTRTAGVNFVFDREVKGDTRVTVFLREVSLDEAVRTILQTQSLDMRRLNETTYLVFPATTAKTREYVPLEARTFFLSNVDAKQAATLVRTVVKSRDVFIDDRLNMIVVKDTPEAIRLAAQLIANIDVADPEVVLEVEVLEIAVSRLQELGIRYPTQIGYGLAPVSNVTGAAVAQVLTRSNWGEQVAQIASPSLIANLRATDGSVNLLTNPRIRVRNKEKARIQVGEKVPVFTTQFAGTGIGTSNAIGASTTYIDVGLKVELEPQVHLENEVAMKVLLEVSNILEQVNGPAQTTAYRIGTRQAQTVLRLADGETQVLAGLIQDSERLNASRVPGLGRLPMLGKLFSNELTQTEKTEIVLMITPRIVRDLGRSTESGRGLAAGTDAAAGTPPLLLSAGAGTALDPAGGDGGPGPARRAGRPAASDAPPPAPPAPPDGAAPPPPPPGPLAAVAAARLSLSLPAEVRGGQSVSIELRLEGATLARGAEVELTYEPSAFGIPGPVVAGGSGRAVVTLQGPEGGPQVGRLVLQASPGGARGGTVSVASVTARLADGTAAQGIALPQPVTVGILP
ncbi:MAG: general secretion pathway protein GspD [Burkholderiales bacterium]|nr:general secretion pathway protein GspD [Burkholderiales bacterium]